MIIIIIFLMIMIIIFLIIIIILNIITIIIIIIIFIMSMLELSRTLGTPSSLTETVGSWSLVMVQTELWVENVNNLLLVLRSLLEIYQNLLFIDLKKVINSFPFPCFQ